MTQESFEKFYYKKVAMGEGCGCAERIIDVHEFNRLAGPERAGGPRLRPFRRLRRLFMSKTARLLEDGASET